MSEMLTQEQCQEIVAQVLRHSEADETEVMIGSARTALTRFANNAIHQNVAEESRYLSVRPVFDGRTARATTNKFDPESLRRTVADASALARSRKPDPDLLPMPGPQSSPKV